MDTEFYVTYRLKLSAPSAEAAALEVDRLLQTSRPKDFDVTAAGYGHGGTIFVRVDRGEAKRIA